MSNPLSSLKKANKTPLHTGLGSRPLPVRNPAYNDDESRLLDEITGGMATHRMRTRDPFAGGLPKLVDNNRGYGATPRAEYLRSDSDLSEDTHTPTDHELMSAMMSRITQMEAKVAYQAKELSEKDKTIMVLTEKNRILQKAQSSVDGAEQIRELENKCLLLQEQIHEMETFLADYGMVWVGEKGNPDSAVYNDTEEEEEEEGVWRPGTSHARKFHVDYNLLIENIKDLNVLAGEGVSKVQSTKDGARLKMPDPVQLTLYANGILMFNGPFRPFTDTSTQQCVQDIMDGYFPAELQARYPDGIPFNVTDLRSTLFEDKRQKVFDGQGQLLGGETKPSRLVPTKLENKATKTEPDESENRQVTSQLPGPQMTMEQFLQKLPRSVVKKGQLIDVRDSVGETLQGGKKGASTVTLIETEAVLDMKRRLDNKDGSRPFTPRDTTTLRVKSENGDHTYILKMKFKETVGDLRKYLDLQRPTGQPFDIMSAYPNKTFTEDNITLEEAGLTPNAVLHIKLKK